jgi:hypothetical protein
MGRAYEPSVSRFIADETQRTETVAIGGKAGFELEERICPGTDAATEVHATKSPGLRPRPNEMKHQFRRVFPAEAGKRR